MGAERPVERAGVMNATCALCNHPIDFEHRSSYVWSKWRKVYYCSNFRACEERRGITRPTPAKRHEVSYP